MAALLDQTVLTPALFPALFETIESPSCPRFAPLCQSSHSREIRSLRRLWDGFTIICRLHFQGYTAGTSQR